MRNVLLVDIDSKIPNLALMKLSAHHKALGDRVYLNECSDPDITFVSCIFTWNRGKVTFYPEANLGGPGVSLIVTLPGHIEHTMPDYSLYGCDYSMGFTSRGCIRRCPFCIVPTKEGGIHDNAPVSEFLDPKHRKVMLLDGNLLAAPCCKDVLRELAHRGLLVNFNQGLDIRLVTDEIAALLGTCQYRSMSFRERRLCFAFDDPKLESLVIRGVERLAAAGIPPKHLMFYVLCGFDTTIQDDLRRVDVIRSLGADPYVMKYNNRQGAELNKLARWVNKRICEKVPFSDYTRQYRKTVEAQIQ
jgi:hypothetical protein